MNCSKLFRGSLGFGARNLKHIRAFAEAYPDQQFVQQVVAQFGWRVTTDRRNIARGAYKMVNDRSYRLAAMIKQQACLG
jgi:hypothetical protein